ncbi:MAG: phosphotransferase [Pseudomonadota bacterium]
MPDTALSPATCAQICAQLARDSTYVRHWPLTGGVSAHTTAIEMRQAGDAVRHVVVRRHGDASFKDHHADVTQTEFNLLQALHNAGLSVPPPLLVDASGSLLPSPFLVMELIAGTSHVATAHIPTALAQMADFLAQLHQLDPEQLNLPVLPTGDDPIQGALRYIPDTAELRQLRGALQDWTLRPASARLLHGDFWPGNVLWQDQQLAAVLDWEDASVGSPLSDLAASRCELHVAYGSTAVETFTQRYSEYGNGDAHTDSYADAYAHHADLAVWELYAGYAALSSLHAWGLPANQEQHRRQRTTEFVQRAGRQLLA